MKQIIRNSLKIALLSGAFLLAFTSCEKKTETVAIVAPDETPTEVTTDTPINAAPTDAQIASIAVNANVIDIDYAKIAKSKSTNPEVLKFADTMAKDHQNVIDRAVALATKLSLTPDDNNDTTRSLLEGAATEKTKLNALSGAEFDKEYVNNEVAYHEAVIQAVENTLIPNAQNQELKELLQSAVPIFKEHLEHAKHLQATLNK